MREGDDHAGKQKNRHYGPPSSITSTIGRFGGLCLAQISECRGYLMNRFLFSSTNVHIQHTNTALPAAALPQAFCKYLTAISCWAIYPRVHDRKKVQTPADAVVNRMHDRNTRQMGKPVRNPCPRLPQGSLIVNRYCKRQQAHVS